MLTEANMLSAGKCCMVFYSSSPGQHCRRDRRAGLAIHRGRKRGLKIDYRNYNINLMKEEKDGRVLFKFVRRRYLIGRWSQSASLCFASFATKMLRYDTLSCNSSSAVLSSSYRFYFIPPTPLGVPLLGRSRPCMGRMTGKGFR